MQAPADRAENQRDLDPPDDGAEQIAAQAPLTLRVDPEGDCAQRSEAGQPSERLDEIDEVQKVRKQPYRGPEDSHGDFFDGHGLENWSFCRLFARQRARCRTGRRSSVFSASLRLSSGDALQCSNGGVRCRGTWMASSCRFRSRTWRPTASWPSWRARYGASTARSSTWSASPTT